MGYSVSDRNRANNNRGQMFEHLVDQGCHVYRQKKVAIIEKTPEPFRVKGKNKDGTFVGWFAGHAQPDYKGTLKGGRAIAFEAKMTVKDRIQRDAVTVHQAGCLDYHFDMGAKVGVCCMIKNTVGFVPWTVWRDMKEIYGRKYMLEKELREFQVATPGYIDFLRLSEGDGYGSK
ncbi:Holliday junction resolvase RecU [Enterococcus diestrammenae]|uniref:Holliday junction resolvase RecU n=1 Tax=Enterococcus diestrammenae TaxID=1155073 RepID=A0ABV0F2V5_9ENTE|nr:Holliday junction resolvase RecU [Enterococcus diestrammenae]KAF1294786.1 recombination protein U [Enterococcus diestrammenae]